MKNTDFCLNGGRNTMRSISQQPPYRTISATQSRNANEFFLAENLPGKARKRVESEGNRADMPKTGSFSSLPQQLVETKPKLNSHSSRISFDVIPTASNPVNNVIRSSLREEYANQVTAIDILRPRYDHTGFFSISQPNKLPVPFSISLTKLSFRTSTLDYPPERIVNIYVYMSLFKQTKQVGNVIEVELKESKQGRWTPAVFRDFSVIADSSCESSLFVEIVLKIKFPSPRGSMTHKYTKIADGQMKLIRTQRNRFVPPDPEQISLMLNRTGASLTENIETSFNFSITTNDIYFETLPRYFLCPSETLGAYAMIMKQYLLKYDPLTGDFSNFQSNFSDFVLFQEISRCDRVFSKVLEFWDRSTFESLCICLRKYYMCMLVNPSNNGFSLNSDTLEKAVTKAATNLSRGRLGADDKFKPFHSDEIRKSVLLW